MLKPQEAKRQSVTTLHTTTACSRVKSVKSSRSRDDTVAEDDVAQLIHPLWLTFYDEGQEASYHEWFYVETKFYGGKLWSVLALIIDVWYLVYYHTDFFHDTKHFPKDVVTNKAWIPMVFHMIFTIIMFSALFIPRLYEYREQIFLTSVASHWPAYAMATLFGKAPHSFVYYWLVVCWYFCATISQVRFARAIFVVMLWPLVVLMVATFAFDYWDNHSYIEIVFWTFSIGPILLLRHFESVSRACFVSVQQARDEMAKVKDLGEKTHQLLAKLFPATATQLLVVSHGDSVPVTVHKHTALIISDIVGFTRWTAATDPNIVVHFLSAVFFQYDHYAATFNIEKISTVGDSFVGAIFADNEEGTKDTRDPRFGAPPRERRYIQAILFATQCQRLQKIYVAKFSMNIPIQIRIGVHCGNLIGSFVGRAPLKYDLFGPAMEKTKLLESRGEPQLVHASTGIIEEISAFATPRNVVRETFEDEATKLMPLGVLITTIAPIASSARDTFSVQSDSETSTISDTPERTKRNIAVSRALLQLAASNVVGRRLSTSTGGSTIDRKSKSGAEEKKSRRSNRVMDYSAAGEEEPVDPSEIAQEQRPGQINIFLLIFHNEEREKRFQTFRDKTTISLFTSWFFFVTFQMLFVTQIIFVCMDHDFVNRILTLIVFMTSGGYAAINYVQYHRIETLQQAAQAVISKMTFSHQRHSIDPATAEDRQTLIEVPNAATEVAAPPLFFAILYYFAIPILVTFMTVRTDCGSHYNEKFYLSEIIYLNWLIGMEGIEFLMHMAFLKRSLLTLGAVIAAFVLGIIRHYWYNDNVITYDAAFELTYYIGFVAIAAQSYMAELSLRTVFLLKEELREIKDEHGALMDEALRIMLPEFVIQQQAKDLADKETREAEEEGGQPAIAIEETGTCDASEVREPEIREPEARTEVREMSVASSRTETTVAVAANRNRDRLAGEPMFWEYPRALILFISFHMLDPKDVRFADETFRETEKVLQQNKLIKIKTVGTKLLAVGGIDGTMTALRTNAATAYIISVIRAMMALRAKVLATHWDEFTIGVHDGPCFGAVMGKHGVCFDVFGDTVNTASRMESTATNTSIRFTENIATLLMEEGTFNVMHFTEKVNIKGKGAMSVFEIPFSGDVHPSPQAAPA